MEPPREVLTRPPAQATHVSPERAQAELDPRWATVQQVVLSPSFARSARLSQFLLYVCERTILGLENEISEQQVGVHVFDRSPDYNSSEDNIVRTQARLLRKKLDEYYAADGQQDPVRIEIPKGAYVPEFRVVNPAEIGRPPGRFPLSKLDYKRFGRRRFIVAIVLAVLSLAGALAYWRHAVNSPGQRARGFWTLLFNDARPTVIVPSDTAFVLYQNYTGRTVGLSEYVTRELWQRTDSPNNIDRSSIASLGRLPYTNVVDLNFCWNLARSPLIDAKHATIRPARDLRMADLKGVNAVLIGARRANPWVELFDRNNTFKGLFNATNHDFVLNQDPRNTELPIYQDHMVNGVNHAYAVVAFIRGLTGQENVLLLSGTTTGGTEGAVDFVLNERSLGGFLQKIASGNTPIPHFEVVLDVENVVGSSPRAEVVAYRIQRD